MRRRVNEKQKQIKPTSIPTSNKKHLKKGKILLCFQVLLFFYLGKMVRGDTIFLVFVGFVAVVFSFGVGLIIYQARKIDRLEQEKAQCFCPFFLEQNETAALRGVDIVIIN